MAHIELPAGQPGIRGLLQARPDTARPLLELAQTLLRPAIGSEAGLSSGERELVAAYVSARNGCRYCFGSHAAVARLLLGERAGLVDATVASPDAANLDAADLDAADLDTKLTCLLAIAAAVTDGGLSVTADLVQRARQAGATDADVHDTVLIAAAFCMYNRYVDGLATSVPDDPAAYETAARTLVAHGYQTPASTSPGA